MKKALFTSFPLAVAAALLAAPPPALACSVCACGDPLLSSIDPAATNGRLRLQLDTEYLRVDAGNEADPTLTDQLAQWSYRLNAVYRPLEALSLSATLPFVTKTMHMVGGGVSELTSDVSAVGDVEVAGRYALWRGVNLGIGRVQEIAVAVGAGEADDRDPHAALPPPGPPSTISKR